ncbi:MAG: heavy metal response regulator transcription factor [Betaproteobacteria bacterium]|nr:heavy metal response regulator transcription factor [Betaproteobacteria bacterium]
MHLLIIEDEHKTAAYLQKGLVENGFVVDHAQDGQDGLFLATTGDYDMAIIDVMLPSIDGWTVVKELRKNGKFMPVLFLTARDSVSDRVKGLELGADDYLIKPFAFSELLARVRSLLRRSPIQQPELIRVADLEIDLIRHKASRAGRKLALTQKEFSLITLLARRYGEVISRTVIEEQIWDMNFYSDTNVVDVAIRRLRSKVDDPFDRKLIHTLRGVGYVLEERQN